jgi:hypothetical protein
MGHGDAPFLTDRKTLSTLTHSPKDNVILDSSFSSMLGTPCLLLFPYYSLFWIPLDLFSSSAPLSPPFF